MTINYIKHTEALKQCITLLKDTGYFSIDLEFDKNRYRYGFNLCLVQIYIPDQCFIIDPLVETLDIEELFPVLEDPSILKITYSFGEDLRLLHALGCLPKGLFDIAIALRLLDYTPMSLANALQAILEIEINKSAQKSNWFNRPLSEKQIKYAANDVCFLIDMKAALDKKADKAGIQPWIDEEHQRLNKLYYGDIDNNVFLKDKDKVGMTAYEFFIFKGLMELREVQAKKYNRPSYQVLDKEYLRELAQRPKQIHRFEKIKGTHKALKNAQFKAELWKHRENLELAAKKQNISKTDPAMERLSETTYRQRKQERTLREKVKRQIFKPIQKLIAQNHGENVVTYILGNRLMDELSLGNTENLRQYRRMLIERYAKELNLDVKPYLDAKLLEEE